MSPKYLVHVTLWEANDDEFALLAEDEVRGLPIEFATEREARAAYDEVKFDNVLYHEDVTELARGSSDREHVVSICFHNAIEQDEDAIRRAQTSAIRYLPNNAFDLEFDWRNAKVLLVRYNLLPPTRTLASE